MRSACIHVPPHTIAVLLEVDPPEGDSTYVATVRAELGSGVQQTGVAAVVTREGAVVILRSAGSDESPRPDSRVWPDVSAGRLRLLFWSRTSAALVTVVRFTRLGAPTPSAPPLHGAVH